MSTYYDVIAKLDGATEVLYGSFVKQDCKEEIDAERETWKAEGYKSIKIVSRETTDKPDPEIYGDVVSKHELWMQQAPSFNFELDEDELLAEALERGFVTVLDTQNDMYIMNINY